MEFSIALSPVSASRPRLGTWGAYYEGTYKTFKKDVDPLMQRAFRDLLHDIPAGPLDVWIRMYVTRPKTTKLDYPRGDVDNFAKAVMDAANGYAWVDDNQVVDLHAFKRWSTPGELGYFTVRVEPHRKEND